MIDIMQILDKANDDVSGLFRAYCIEQGKIPKEVCISAKAKGIKSILCANYSMTAQMLRRTPKR